MFLSKLELMYGSTAAVSGLGLTRVRCRSSLIVSHQSPALVPISSARRVAGARSRDRWASVSTRGRHATALLLPDSKSLSPNRRFNIGQARIWMKYRLRYI